MTNNDDVAEVMEVTEIEEVVTINDEPVIPLTEEQQYELDKAKYIEKLKESKLNSFKLNKQIEYFSLLISVFGESNIFIFCLVIGFFIRNFIA